MIVVARPRARLLLPAIVGAASWLVIQSVEAADHRAVARPWLATLNVLCGVSVAVMLGLTVRAFIAFHRTARSGERDRLHAEIRDWLVGMGVLRRHDEADAGEAAV